MSKPSRPLSRPTRVKLHSRGMCASVLAAGLLAVPMTASAKGGAARGKTTQEARPSLNTYALLSACSSEGKVSVVLAKSLLGLSRSEVNELKKKASAGQVSYRSVAEVFHASKEAREVQLTQLLSALKSHASAGKLYAAVEKLVAGGRQLTTQQVSKLASDYSLSETAVRAVVTVASSVTSDAAGSTVIAAP